MRRIHAQLKRHAPRALAAVALAALTACGSGGASTADTRTSRPVRDTTTTRTTTTRAADQTAAQQAPAPTRTQFQAQTPAPDRADWRPPWWLTAPTRSAGVLKVTAMADDPDLLAARRRAVDKGLAELRAQLGSPEGRAIDPETTIDVIHLPTGHYRAFVLVEAPY